MSTDQREMLGSDHARVPWFSLERAGEVRWGLIAAYVGIAYALAWLALLPIWLTTKNVSDPRMHLLASGMMFTPTLAALIVGKFIGKDRDWLRSVGLKHSRGIGPTAAYSAIGVGLVLIMLWTGAAISHLFGWMKLDPGLSLVMKQVQDAGQPAQPWAVMVVGLVLMAVLGVIATVPQTLGEEIGWRGFLTPALMPLGKAPALVLSGIIWALWHSPLIFIGFNYPGYPRPAAMGLMIVFCILLGTILSWTRAASTSVIPAAVAHAAVNALASEPFKWTAVDTPMPPDMGLTPPMGVSGLALLLLLSGVVLALKWAPAPRRSANRDPQSDG